METKILNIFGKTLAKICKKSKKLTAFLLAAFIGTGAVNATGAYIGHRDHQVTYGISSEEENKVGYDDINVYYNKEVHSNEFVILHINNKDFQDISLLRAKLQKCNDANISVGLVLDTNASTLSEIYKDVDFLQAVIKEYNIDLPIYCNIDNIMSNENLNTAQKGALVQAFIDKASRSKMFLGLYGTDSVLTNFNEYVFNIGDYDCYLVMDSEERKYQGTTSIVEDLDGNITASQNLAEVIRSRGLNSPSKLVYSSLYTIKEGDTIESLALQYGLSVEDLKSYNSDKSKDFEVGDVIKIPNLYVAYDTNREEVQYNYAIARGIDISNYQTNFDWNRIAETSDYVIVEVSRDPSDYLNKTGTYLEEAPEMIKSTLNSNIDLGLYFCISKDMNMETYRGRLENYLTNLVNDLNGVEIDFSNIPVFLDFEVYYDNNDYYGLMKIFEETCKKYGFTTFGIYGNTSTLRSISNNMERIHGIPLKDTDWKIWQSGGPQYSANESTDPGIKLEDLKEIGTETDSEVGFVADMRQVTNVCIDTGASNDAGHCDVSYLYTEDIFGNELPPQEDLVDVLEIDLSNYTNISFYDAGNIASLVADYIFAVTGSVVTVTVLSIGLYSAVVGIYRKQKTKRR